MIGEKFKSLTVISLDEDKNNQLKEERRLGLRSNAPIYYICQCECGNILSLAKQKIKNRKEEKCKKCKNIDFSKYIGEKINSWTILDYKENKFLCKCNCGTIKTVNPYNVINNQSKDCGCGRKQTMNDIHSKEDDIIGNKFGRLTPLKIVGKNKFRKTLYECQCDCGKLHTTTASALLGGYTMSCGCLHSKMNSIISQFLQEQNIDFDSEKFCRYNDTEYGKFDFYLKKYNLVIEYDGEDHYMPIDRAGKGEEWAKEKLKMTQYRDKLKNQYCKENNINLLRIPYWEKENYQTIILNYIITLND